LSVADVALVAFSIKVSVVVVRSEAKQAHPFVAVGNPDMMMVPPAQEGATKVPAVVPPTAPVTPEQEPVVNVGEEPPARTPTIGATLLEFSATRPLAALVALPRAVTTPVPGVVVASVEKAVPFVFVTVRTPAEVSEPS
jgi:hypothetical protein